MHSPSATGSTARARVMVTKRRRRVRGAAAWLLGLLTLVAGCSGAEVYRSGEAGRVLACENLLDDRERASCLEQARRSYEEYERLRRQPAATQ